MKFLKSLRRKYAKINPDVLLFTSFYGKYADSPRILSEVIHRIAPEKTIVWLLNNLSNEDVPSYVEKVKYGSKEADVFYGKAKGIIDNTYCDHEYYTQGNGLVSKIKFKIGTFLKNKKGQKYYTTWHGTMIKKVGSDSNRNNSFNFSCSNTTMFLDNKFASDVLRRVTKGQISIRIMGEPRNDILFDKDIDLVALKKKLGLPDDKKVVIYAPTFRSNDDETKNIENSGVKQINELDIDKLLATLSNKFGGDWVFVARFHYHVEKAVDWKKLKNKYGNKVINGNKCEDIMDYLACCDVLLTDISSCVYDFCLTNKPAFLYFPDYCHYNNDERGLYFEKDELPWDMSMDSLGLYESIEKFDRKKYKKRLVEFYARLGFAPPEQCADKIARYIINDLSEQ